MEYDEVLRILGGFEKEGLEYILIGAVALNLHGISRATQDIDIFIRPDRENFDRLRKALRELFQDDSVDEISAEDLCGRYPTVRYIPPHGSLFLDILTRLGEFAGYEDLSSQEIELEGITVRVATPETLYWLKKGTLRPIDQADALMLKEKFELEED